MKNFYGNIADTTPEDLLRATPYTQVSQFNFNRGLTKEIFYKHLYTPRSEKKEDFEENSIFDNKIDRAFRELNNPYAKVTMIHISGYAGCGKTTYIHHLLWEYKERIKTYEVIDYEGHKKAVEPFIDRLTLSLAKKPLIELADYLHLLINRDLFIINRFREYLPYLEYFQKGLKNIAESDDKAKEFRILLESMDPSVYNNIFTSERNKNLTQPKSFLFFLILLEFMLLLFSQFDVEKEKSMVLVIDNSDSLDDLSEEMKLLPAMRDFINECTYFFGDNRTNQIAYRGKTVEDVCNRTKLVVFFTTRVVTKTHYTIIQPDWEEIVGLTSLSLPEHYYDQKEMILKRIDYYLSEEDQSECQTVAELRQIRSIVDAAYHNFNFMRLFNGNSRKCIERICSIIYNNPQETINELINLGNERENNAYAIEGYNGYLLSLVLRDFKSKGIYKTKLGLSNCRKDGMISLSRVILTILREKSDRCSLLEMFEQLVPMGFSSFDICKCAWDLCEEERTFWRRLLIFDMIMPKRLEELNRQAVLFNEGDRDIEHYSELVICTAGRAYMENVVPHFEFMLSRLESGTGANTKAQYQPLFSGNSERSANPGCKQNGDIVYLFERKIDLVYRATKECCYNASQFSERAIEVFNYERNNFLQNSFLNYHTVGWEGEIGPKQSYESRLIFRHVSYIEKYRKYLLRKYRNDAVFTLIEINLRLVERIVKYIHLYQELDPCFKTEAQDVAASELLKIADRIRKSNFRDFHSRIELS